MNRSPKCIVNNMWSSHYTYFPTYLWYFVHFTGIENCFLRDKLNFIILHKKLKYLARGFTLGTCWGPNDEPWNLTWWGGHVWLDSSCLFMYGNVRFRCYYSNKIFSIFMTNWHQTVPIIYHVVSLYFFMPPSSFSLLEFPDHGSLWPALFFFQFYFMKPHLVVFI